MKREQTEMKRENERAASPGRARVVMAVGATLVIVGSLIGAAGHGWNGGAGAVHTARTRSAAHTASAIFLALPRGQGTARKVLDLTSTDNLPADCLPNPAGPPGAPYQLGLAGTVHGGVLTAGPATIPNIDVTFCGVVTVVAGTPPCGATGSVVSPPDGQIFSPLSASLTLVPGMSPSIGFTANPGTITGTFSCDSSANGLNVTLDATVSGSTGALFGVSCTIGPLTIPLTGTVTGPFTDLTATLTSDDFTVPAIQASPTCSGGLPANVDAVVGLPIAPGGASATLPVTASLYQPAS
jgi:hypothetical protein